MKRINFTAGRVDDFKCQPNKQQSIFWDGKTPGLGLRVTAAGAKAYIFESRLNSQTIRMTIGDTRTWAIGEAQAEATRLKNMINQGIDPRQVIADARAAKEAKAVAKRMQEARESVTVGDAWQEYIAVRKTKWSERHFDDHVKLAHPGGVVRSRSDKLTVPGPLAGFMSVRLADLTKERVETWAEVESSTRPTRARLALRLLKAFLNWCSKQAMYGAIIQIDAAKSGNARESLGKPKPKDDVLQREQLPAWFAAVKQIGNPVISAYLQGLLLTGARRNELAAVKWEDVDFHWNSMTIRDKVEGLRVIPLTPYVAHLLAALPRRNAFVFSSPTAASGRIEEPRLAHNKACFIAGVDVTLHGLRRSFASLCEWTETPAGIAAQIQGHAPQGVREQNYIRRPLDLLRMWHVKIESWILEQAEIKFDAEQAKPGLRVVKQ